jgi:hypothetical protein
MHKILFELFITFLLTYGKHKRITMDMPDQPARFKNKRGDKKMLWGLWMILGISAMMFVGGLIYSFRTTGRVKRGLTLAGMML